MKKDSVVDLFDFSDPLISTCHCAPEGLEARKEGDRYKLPCDRVRVDRLVHHFEKI